jgi:catechol 2,3-dioxygenase-like lactoylglutathione lyase family enzyme
MTIKSHRGSSKHDKYRHPNGEQEQRQQFLAQFLQAVLPDHAPQIVNLTINHEDIAMFHIEHLNLVVSDIPASLAFYKAAFPHWQVRASGDSPWNGKARKWLHFGDDYQYLTFNDNGIGENRDLDGHQIGLAHFAFTTDNMEALIQRLADAGFAPNSDGADEPYRRNVYFLDPAGFEIEFVQYLSDIPQQRNLSS